MSSEAGQTQRGWAQPQVFAILRNAHEVIRGGMKDCQEAIDKNDKDLFL